MLVTEIAPIDKKSVKIYLDGGRSFRVYIRDFRKYPVLAALQPGQEIGESVLAEVYQKILLPRARESALCMLERADRSEWEIRKKLKEKDYPEELSDEVILYLKEYHYLDEERLVHSYLAMNAGKKSRRMIFQKLKEKGISEQMIQRVMDEEEYEGNTAAAAMLQKKLGVRTEAELSWDEKQKINAYLYRKGFSGDEIYRAWGDLRQ